MNYPNQDPAQNAIQRHIEFLRGEIVIWFLVLVMLTLLGLYDIYQLYQVQSTDYNRDFVPVDSDNKQMVPDFINKPHPRMTTEDVLDWTIKQVKFCMTFDYINYASVSNYCNANIFTLRSSPNPDLSYGQYFYNALEKSDIVKTLIDNRTSMTIEYVDTQIKAPPSEINNVYSYPFEFEFKVQMQGQKLDAPIVYDVTVQRVSLWQRRSGLGIQFVISQR